MFNESKPLYFVTGNVHKFEEASRILLEFDITIKRSRIRRIEIQSDSLEEIARVGSLDAAKRLGKTTIVEDAGLFVEALKGFPGPYSSYVLGTIGLEGILKLMEGIENRRATFRSVVAFADPAENVKTFEGIVQGSITDRPRGLSGFGFDPIFIPEGHMRTFAEMSLEDKNKLSHRSFAFRAFASWYSTHRS